MVQFRGFEVHMLFFMHIAHKRWMFWELKYDTNIYILLLHIWHMGAVHMGAAERVQWVYLGSSLRKKKQPIMNEFSEMNQMANCKGGGVAANVQ